MSELTQQTVLDFYTYPPVGSDDWQYAFQTAQVRSLETLMLTRAALLDMTNAQNFEQAAVLRDEIKGLREQHSSMQA